MVSVDKIEEEEMTREEVMDREFAEPMDEVRMLQEWEDYPEERPGENLRIEDGWLIWQRDGFEVRLESYETTHWRALVTIPKDVGKWLPRPIDLQCRSIPKHGFIKSVETEEYRAREAELVLQENFMPTHEVNKFIDDLIEFKEGSEERQQQIEEKLNAAAKVEERLKKNRLPGWSEEDEELVCPHCKESSEHVVKRDDGGFDCLHCGESVDEYVESRGED